MNDLRVIYTTIQMAALFGPLYIGSYFLVRKIKEPPEIVKIAGYLEVASGIFILLFSYMFGFYLERPIQLTNFFIKWLILYSIGMSWLLMAIQIFKGNKTSRKVFLIVSIIRALTIIGIIFSFISIYCLYINKKGKDFFKTTDGIH